MQINDKLNGEKLTNEQEKLINDQIQQQEELEKKHRDEERKENRELENELATEQQNVDDQIEQQKLLVCDLVMCNLKLNLIQPRI